MKRFGIILLLCLVLSACNLADRRVEDFRSLIETVERRGNRFTTQEWEETYQQYKQLEADFNDLNLTEAQADSVYYLTIRFHQACSISPLNDEESQFEEVTNKMLEKSEETLNAFFEEVSLE